MKIESADTECSFVFRGGDVVPVLTHTIGINGIKYVGDINNWKVYDGFFRQIFQNYCGLKRRFVSNATIDTLDKTATELTINAQPEIVKQLNRFKQNI